MKILYLAIFVFFASCSNGGGSEKGPENTPTKSIEKIDTIKIVPKEKS